MRAKLDPLFTQFLLKIRDGLEQADCVDSVVISSSILIKYTSETDAL